MKELFVFTYCECKDGTHDSMQTISAKNERINDLKAMILDELLLNEDIETKHYKVIRDKRESAFENITFVTKAV